ncbi:MAG: hypothetical protein ACTSV2_06925 [Candidatus Thorarchaeota archaeon]
MSIEKQEQGQLEDKKNLDLNSENACSVCLWSSLLIILCIILIVGLTPDHLSLFRIAGLMTLVPVLVFGIGLSLYMIHRNLSASTRKQGIPEPSTW